MSFTVLDAEIVDRLHNAALNPGELAGRARDKSLEGALARVDNRLAYGMIGDVFDLAAAYAGAIAQGRCYNDGNKRTAFRAMHAVLHLNGVKATFVPSAIGDKIILLAQGKIDDLDLADWLRAHA